MAMVCPSCMVLTACALVVIAFLNNAAAISSGGVHSRSPRRALSAAAPDTLVPLGASYVEQFTLLHKPPQPGVGRAASTAVQFMVFHPSTAAMQQQQQQQQRTKLPVLFLLNGANVDAQQYSTLAHNLNKKGYTFVASDYYQQLPATLLNSPAYLSSPANNWTMPAVCPGARGQMLSPTAALIQTFLKHAAGSKTLSLEEIQQRGIVLVSHSMGAAVAIQVMTGCSADEQPYGFRYCEGYTPSLRTTKTSSSSSSSSSSSNGSSGSTSTKITTCPVPNSAAKTQGLILGAMVFEGYKSITPPPPPPPAAVAAVKPATGQQPGSRPATTAASAAPNTTAASSFVPAGITIPPGTFLLYMGGQYHTNKTGQAYRLSNASSCSCIGYAQFAGLNHYGINNWQGPGTKQITPCGRPASSDPLDVNVTSRHQNAQLQNMADLMDTFIRAAVFRDGSAKLQLQQQQKAEGKADVSGVMDVGYTLELKPQCFQ